MFLRVVQDAKTRIRECTIQDVHDKRNQAEQFFLVDVREEGEWLGDIEKSIPETTSEIILYCGGGFRSALSADNLQKMGYTNVISMDGGFRGWSEAGFAIAQD